MATGREQRCAAGGGAGAARSAPHSARRSAAERAGHARRTASRCPARPRRRCTPSGGCTPRLRPTPRCAGGGAGGRAGAPRRAGAPHAAAGGGAAAAAAAVGGAASSRLCQRTQPAGAGAGPEQKQRQPQAPTAGAPLHSPQQALRAEVPPGLHIARFTPDGRHLVCFSSDASELVLFEWLGPAPHGGGSGSGGTGSRQGAAEPAVADGAAAGVPEEGGAHAAGGAGRALGAPREQQRLVDVTFSRCAGGAERTAVPNIAFGAARTHPHPRPHLAHNPALRPRPVPPQLLPPAVAAAPRVGADAAALPRVLRLRPRRPLPACRRRDGARARGGAGAARARRGARPARRRAGGSGARRRRPRRRRPRRRRRRAAWPAAVRGPHCGDHLLHGRRGARRQGGRGVLRGRPVHAAAERVRERLRRPADAAVGEGPGRRPREEPRGSWWWDVEAAVCGRWAAVGRAPEAGGAGAYASVPSTKPLPRSVPHPVPRAPPAAYADGARVPRAAGRRAAAGLLPRPHLPARRRSGDLDGG
jgi:hypothetical protein